MAYNVWPHSRSGDSKAAVLGQFIVGIVAWGC